MADTEVTLIAVLSLEPSHNFLNTAFYSQFFVDDDNDGVFSIASNGSVVINPLGLKNVNTSVVTIGAKDRKSKKVGRAVVSVKIVTQALNKIDFVDFPNDGVDVDLSDDILNFRRHHLFSNHLFLLHWPQFFVEED